MLKEINKLLAFALILLISQAGLICIYFFTPSAQDSHLSNNITFPNSDLPIHYSYFAQKEFYDEAYQYAQEQLKPSADKVYGGIIPHHLIVKDKIAAFFEGIKDYEYDTVILIGPNHFDNGQSDILSSRSIWKTPYGNLRPDLILLENLNLNIDEEPFFIEHSISSLVPFIKKSFPQAKFIPIILKVNANQEKVEQLAENIYNNTDHGRTLILASVDFSHYQPLSIADFHDLRSNAVISDFDFSRIYDLEIDSPASIYTVLKYLDLIQAQDSELLFSTNSGILFNQPDEPTTSHNFFYFTNGSKNDTNVVSFLFFGDLMLDRSVKKVIDDKGINHLFDGIAGEEKRFFKGVDIVSANLEGAVTNGGQHYSPSYAYDFAFHPDWISQLKEYKFNFFNLANNHLTDQGQKGVTETQENLDKLLLNYVGCSDGQVGSCSSRILDVAGKRIGFLGMSMVYSHFDMESIRTTVSELIDETDLIIANVHWGVEYTHQFNGIQQNIAHNLIDAGVDVIIGHHPHVVQGMEVYKDKPIFYSLGNFIFDQYFSNETQEGLAIGLATDLNSDNNYKLYLYPFKSHISHPQLMKNTVKEDFFSRFTSWSQIDNQYKTQILQGFLSLSSRP